MHSNTAPPTAYDIGGQHWLKDAPGFDEAIAHAFEQRLRPRCLCRRDTDGHGIEMYVARLIDGYIVKRMPNTGNQHDITCMSYELPSDLNGLGQLLGSAITENPATGETTLTLDFPLIKMPGRQQVPPAGDTSESVTRGGARLSLRGLLHYLWDQAELSRWHPWFEGKRSWSTVRKHLTLAADQKLARGYPLQSMLYIPEVFCVEQREAINTRMFAQWGRANATHGKPHQLMLLIAEVKEIAPAKYGHKAVMKHMPDQAFALDEQLYRRMIRRFEAELSLWGTSESIRMVVIATFNVSERGVPTIHELSFMPTTGQWLPIESRFEQQLIERLLREGRSFVKGLPYTLHQGRTESTAILIDTGPSPVPLCIVHRGTDNDGQHGIANEFGALTKPLPWKWAPSSGAMPPLPEHSSS